MARYGVRAAPVIDSIPLTVVEVVTWWRAHVGASALMSNVGAVPQHKTNKTGCCGTMLLDLPRKKVYRAVASFYIPLRFVARNWELLRFH